jgi:hypothetical protein
VGGNGGEVAVAKMPAVCLGQTPGTQEAGGDVREGDDERRRHRRLALRFPLFLSAEGEFGQFVEHATSENVSAGGVYFRTGAWNQMPVGTHVDVYIEIPSENALFGHRNQLSSVGRVVRVDPAVASAPRPHTPRGVAIQFDRELRFAK